MKNHNKKQKVIILGAGLAGLSAGYELVKEGYQVEVFEKETQVGGLAKTVVVDSFFFDTGPHRWYSKSNIVNKWFYELLGKETIKVPRLTRIYFGRKFFFYPIRLINALIGIGPIKAFWAIFDYSLARMKVRFMKPELITMEDGYINQFGKTLYELFFKRYSEKLWGRDCREISIDWVGQRTRGLNIFTMIKEALFKSRKVVSLVDEFSYPKEGIGAIGDKLVSNIIKSGGKVYTDCEVVKLNRGGEDILSMVIKNKEGKKTVEGDYFISSIPLDDLVRRLSPKVKKDVLGLSNKLKYRDEIQVVLFIKKSHITKDTWIYIHPKEIPFMRVMEMDNWSSLLSPNGTTTLVFEIACNEQDKMWKKTDKELINLVASSYIREFNFIEKKDIIGSYVHRCLKEYPIYHLGYKEDVDKVKKYLQKFSNLQIVGRNGTFRYNNMDHSIEMGLYAAWNIIAGRKKFDVESVNIEREYLEEKRIENIEDETLEKPQTLSTS